MTVEQRLMEAGENHWGASSISVSIPIALCAGQYGWASALLLWLPAEFCPELFCGVSVLWLKTPTGTQLSGTPAFLSLVVKFLPQSILPLLSWPP